MVSFLIDEVLAVEAGSLASELTFAEQKNIRAILLSHAHYDHVAGVPVIAFNNADGNSSHFVKVFATQQTLESIKAYLINGIIYPEFAESTSYLGKPSLLLTAVEPYQSRNIEGYRVILLPVRHPINAVGLGITSEKGESIFYTGDTGPELSYLWEHVSPQVLIADGTFPNRLEMAARDSGHLCPKMLKEELLEFRRIKGYLPRVVLVHLSPEFESEIRVEAGKIAQELNISLAIPSEGDTLLV
jgi:ribonuclease BN (tRNA processing enzyme)